MLMNFLNEKNVFIDPPETERGPLLKMMADKAEEIGYITSSEAYLSTMEQKEQQQIMELAPHVMLPHARGDFVKKLFVMLAINKNGFSYPHAKKNKADIVLMVGIPTEDREYLKLLANISRLILEGHFVQGLLDADVMDDVKFVIKKCSTRIERSANENPKKYLLMLMLNKLPKQQELIPSFLTEVGMDLPTEIEGKNIGQLSAFGPFLSNFGFSSGFQKYCKVYIGLTDEKDAAAHLFSLLKDFGTDLDQDGVGSLMQIELTDSYGGYSEGVDF